MGIQQPIDGQEVVNFWDDSWRAPAPRAEVTSTPEAVFVPFDSVRDQAIEVARAGVDDFFASTVSPEEAQATMNNRSDLDNL